MAYRRCPKCTQVYDLNADGPYGFEHEDHCPTPSGWQAVLEGTGLVTDDG